ncbi:MAG: DUF4105 domain-containing protein [Planctomycetota bacterium]
MTELFIYPVIFLIALWSSGALYFDVGDGGWKGWGLFGLCWIAASAAVLLLTPLLAAFAVGITFTLFLLWWLRQEPSHERAWDACFDRLPKVSREGKTIRVTNMRHSRYVSQGKCEVHWEERCFDLSKLQAVDAMIIFWGGTWKCHPMAIFDFGTDGKLCFSIEVRYREGEEFGILPGIYRQNELMYVVCDERDAILRRCIYYADIDCYLYRLQSDIEFARGLLEEYIAATNEIFENPKWYHAFCSNCTTEIIRNRREEVPWDWRMLLNGRFDKMLYDKQLLLNSLPFDELKAKSRVNEIAQSAQYEHFAEEIRKRLPGFDEHDRAKSKAEPDGESKVAESPGASKA